MQREVLLIRGGSAARVVDALAVAAEIAAVCGDDAQVDIVTPAEFAPYASLGSAARRVIAVAAPDTGDWSDVMAGGGGGEEDAGGGAGGGFGGKLLSAAKKISSVAGKNVRAYWSLASEMRLTQYSVVFDFDFSAFSIAISKLAKTERIVGFDPQTLEHPMPGASLSAHDVFAIKGDMCPSLRLRHLAAKVFDYRLATEDERLEWGLRSCAAPDDAPPAPYAVVGADLPAPFLAPLEEGGALAIARADEGNAEALAGLVQGAALVVGGGAAAGLAAAAGVRCLYVGNQQQRPCRAEYIATPAEMAAAVAGNVPVVGQVGAAAEPAPAASEPASADAGESSVLDEATPAVESTPEAPKTIKLKSSGDSTTQ